MQQQVMAAESGWIFQGTGDDKEPPQKKQGVASVVVNQALQDELDHLTLSVSNAVLLRQQMGAVYLSAQAPAAIVEPPVTAIKTFTDMTKGKSRHKLGHPHIQGYGAFLHNLVNMTAEKAKNEAPDQKLIEALAILNQALTNMTNEGVKSAHFHISQFVCKMTKSDENTGTVNMCLSDMMDPADRAKTNRALVYAMESMGATVNQGGPPPSPAERRVKERIAEIRKQMGIADTRTKKGVKTEAYFQMM